MSFWVYILQCADDSYYTGHTDNMEKRLAQHAQGTPRCYTSSRLPVKLVFCGECPSREEALSDGRRIKGWTRRKKMALIEEDWGKLVEYSRSRESPPSTSSG